MLLEREDQITCLRDALHAAASGRGRAVLVTGEAGIGKTALTRAFLDEIAPRARIVRGACEDLSIAAPLAPLFDIARELGWTFSPNISSQGDRLTVFSEAIAALDTPGQPTVVLVEDFHWADDATSDFLKFLGRRISASHILLIVTSRDDEQSGRNHIRGLASALPRDSVTRIPLAPLSRETVAKLARAASKEPQEVYALSGGNAFFVLECLQSARSALSDRVQEVVLARVDTLPADARDLLDVMSVVPGKADRATILSLSRGGEAAIRAAVDAGLIEDFGDFLGFRHELGRQSVESALPARRRQDLNAQHLAALQGADGGAVGRLLHHARQADDRNAIAQYATPAADEAARLGASRQAAEYAQLAVDIYSGDDKSLKAGLLRQLGWARYMIAEYNAAIDAESEALAIFRQLGDTVREGDGYRRLSRFQYTGGNRKKAVAFGERALQVLQGTNGPELAMAYSTLSQLRMLNFDYANVSMPAKAAIKLAQQLGNRQIEAHALNNLGQSLVWSDPQKGREYLARSIAIAKEINSPDDVARGTTNSGYFEQYRLQSHAALELFERAAAYTAATQQTGYLNYCEGSRANTLIMLGHWDAALEEAQQCFDRMRDQGDLVGSQVFPASNALLWLWMRRGLPGTPDPWNTINHLITGMAEIQRESTFAQVRCERAWLGLEDGEAAFDYAQTVVSQAADPVCLPLTLLWMKLLQPGFDAPTPPNMIEPVRLQLQGDWQAAAEAWHRATCPFYEALALAQGDDAAVERAAQILSGLKATATLDQLNKNLRAAGRSPKALKPRQSTLDNPAGLTKRQMDVLRALNDGLSNAEIGERLFIAPKTVDHHVSAIIAKLNVRTRAEAAAQARENGWI